MDRGPASYQDVLNRGKASAATASSAITAMERESGLRFVGRLRGGARPSEIATAIERAHGLDVLVEPVFAGADPAAVTIGLDQFVLIGLPGLVRADLSGTVFDLAYRLRDATPRVAFAEVEPVVPAGIYVGNPQPYDPDFSAEADVARCKVPAMSPADRYWHLRRMRVPEAWQLEPSQGGARFGEGIVVGHPDTGWADHAELDHEALDTGRGWNFCEGGNDARDPLWGDALVGAVAEHLADTGDLRSPGHGTGTGSVIVSRGSVDIVGGAPAAAGDLTGVAPRATLVPIRAVRFVGFVDAVPVARAIEHAANTGCHVVSMSLGGVGSAVLEAAVNHAVAQNLIVCAAAGNCLAWDGSAGLVAPGNYPNCIGVGGTTQSDRPWPFSSRGPTVDISAPAEHVWRAQLKQGDPSVRLVEAGQGTSFAVAGVAGVAALWLAFHERNKLLDRYRGRAYLHHVFRYLVQTTARRPGEWWPSEQFGPGVVDAAALLAADLPEPDHLGPAAMVGQMPCGARLNLIAAMFPKDDRVAVRNLLAALLAPGHPPESAAVDKAIEQWGAELIHILTLHGDAYGQFAEHLQRARETNGAPVLSQAAMLAADGIVRWASGALREVLHRSLVQP